MECTPPPSLEHMLAAWNERDLDKIRSHLDAALSPDVHFVDPDNDIRGIDAFEEMVRALRTRLPEMVCARESAVDGHHDRYRYEWSVSVGGTVLMPGFDVTTLDEQGRVVQVDGFFGPLPALAS
jgi:hypothetical protein